MVHHYKILMLQQLQFHLQTKHPPMVIQLLFYYHYLMYYWQKYQYIHLKHEDIHIYQLGLNQNSLKCTIVHQDKMGLILQLVH